MSPAEKCEACGCEATLKVKVPVSGFPDPMRRHFCSLDHLDAYMKVAAMLTSFGISNPQCQPDTSLEKRQPKL